MTAKTTAILTPRPSDLKLILTMTVFELLRHKDRMRFQN